MSVSSTRPVYTGLTAIPTFMVMKEEQAARFIDVFLTAMGQQWSPVGKVAYMVGKRVTGRFKTQCYHILDTLCTTSYFSDQRRVY